MSRAPKHFLSADVANILSKPELFGDGPSSWANCISANNARAQDNRLAKRLNRLRYEISGAALLSTTLKACDPPNNVCRSGASISCARAIQRHIVNVGQAVFADYSSDILYLLTIIPERARAPLNELAGADTTSITHTICRIIGAIAPHAKFLGGWDISLNDETAFGRPVLWQPHIHLAIKTTCKDQMLKSLSKAFASDAIHRPVQFKPDFDNSTEALSYIFKAGYFEKKVLYLDHVSGRRKTDLGRFTAAEEVELYLWLHKLGLAGRFLCSSNLLKEVAMK